MHKLKTSTALRVLNVLFTASMLFHFGVLSGIFPNDIIWGGRTELDNWQQFEMVSIGINLLFLFLVYWRQGLLPLAARPKLFRILFLLMAILFMLNTVGNLFAKNPVEMWLFTPITAISCLLSFRISRD
jgi:hypothetical protein